MDATKYACAECGAPASIRDGEVVRTCAHIGTVTASIAAHAVGVGGVVPK